MAADINPAATHHLPMFVVGPGETDILFNVTLVIVIVSIVLLGVLYFKIHALAGTHRSPDHQDLIRDRRRTRVGVALHA